MVLVLHGCLSLLPFYDDIYSTRLTPRPDNTARVSIAVSAPSARSDIHSSHPLPHGFPNSTADSAPDKVVGKKAVIIVLS